MNYVPRITPVSVPRQVQDSDENLPLENHRDAYPLLTIPEQRRSRANPSPNSLAVERSQGETESGRTSIALPRGQRRSDPLDLDMADQHNHQQQPENLRPPEPVHFSTEPRPLGDERPRHVPSQLSLRSQAQIAPVPSNTAQNTAGGEGGAEGGGAGGATDVAEKLAWGPAHPCYPHLNPHVSVDSNEYLTTRVIRIRRDWMIKGDLAPTFSNLYPEILDPLLPEQEFRKVIAHVNDALIKAFDPFSLRSWFDSAIGLLTGWIWEDVGAPGVKSDLKRLESWIENWNHDVGAKEGVHIWSLRQTAYMSLDIQIPDPKVGIVQSEPGSLAESRPNTGPGRGY